MTLSNDALNSDSCQYQPRRKFTNEVSEAKKIYFTPIKQEMSFGPSDNMLDKNAESPGFGPSTETK